MLLLIATSYYSYSAVADTSRNIGGGGGGGGGDLIANIM